MFAKDFAVASVLLLSATFTGFEKHNSLPWNMRIACGKCFIIQTPVVYSNIEQSTWETYSALYNLCRPGVYPKSGVPEWHYSSRVGSGLTQILEKADDDRRGQTF